MLTRFKTFQFQRLIKLWTCLYDDCGKSISFILEGSKCDAPIWGGCSSLQSKRVSLLQCQILHTTASSGSTGGRTRVYLWEQDGCFACLTHFPPEKLFPSPAAADADNATRVTLSSPPSMACGSWKSWFSYVRRKFEKRGGNATRVHFLYICTDIVTDRCTLTGLYIAKLVHINRKGVKGDAHK